MANYRKHLSQPWLGLIKTGQKTVEGRLKKKEWARMVPGDKITFFNDQEEVVVEVVQIKEYKSFVEMITQEGLEKVGIEAIDAQEAAEKVYSPIYQAEEEQKCGVLGIKLKVN